MAHNSLPHNFRKEIKKLDKPRSGDGAPPQTPRWMHFKALQFLRDVIEPAKTSGNIAEQPDSEDTVDENEVNIHFRRMPPLKHRSLLQHVLGLKREREQNRLSVTKKRWYDWREENWSG
jgi:hypothetical protein